MGESLFLKEADVHPDWLPFLSDETRKVLSCAEAEICRSHYTPEAGKVLRFLTLPLSTARIVILGQDPYPQPGAATGRAFEVGNLQSWSQPFKNISLKNILRCLYKAYTGDVITYSRLKEKMHSDFQVLPPGILFDHWERQGVLLLNTSFTCETGNPGSHKSLWEHFTHVLLYFIAERSPEIEWFLWGSHAAGAVKDIPIRKKVTTKHPMMCYDLPGRRDDFLYGDQNCFAPYISCIDWTGYGFKEGVGAQRLLF